jgi:two-component sensor histidine kinase
MEKVLFALLPKVRQPAPVRYGLTVVIVGVAFLLRLSLDEQLRNYPLILFIPAIFLAALVFDRGSGLFATALSAVLAPFHLSGREFVYALTRDDIVALFIFVCVGALIAAITEALHQTVTKLTATEAQKTLLLAELAHRTKNDLMLVSSVLTLQARNQCDPTVRRALESAVARVAVIVKAQEKLGALGENGTVEIEAYLKVLCAGLGDLLRDVRPIAVRIRSDRVQLTSSRAICIGLIVNELTTNAFKYAFPDAREGTIEIDLRQQDKMLFLVVADDGVGYSPQCEQGLGTRLVRLLARQLGGEVQYESNHPGSRITVKISLSNGSAA